jgi:hypothetical protein
MTERTDIFQGLRTRALTVTGADLGLTPNASAPIHGVIMETGYPQAVASFVCLGDGSVSLYLSTGGGVIGGGQHESVREACLEMLSITNKYAQDFIAACKPVSTFALPGTGDVFFYLLANGVVHQARCREDRLEAQQDPFSALFNNCHAVMSELRTAEEKR